jgi:CRISPR/Cas system-associated exonuclease Cas4 (RecB family)
MNLEAQKISTTRLTGFKFREGFEPWPYQKLSQITSENGKRVYIDDHGFKYPSITTVLSADKTRKEILARWRRRVGNDEANRISRASTTRGTALHKLCENYLEKGEVAVSNPMEKENFLKVRGTLDRGLGELFAIEQALCSKELQIAGRCDLIAEWLNPETKEYEPAVIDFKTSGKTKYAKNISHYFIQGAAYATMFKEMTGINVPRVVIIIATEELNDPQVFVENTDTWIQPLSSAIAEYQESVHAEELSQKSIGD